jgi:hypothetical protein
LRSAAADEFEFGTNCQALGFFHGGAPVPIVSSSPPQVSDGVPPVV